MAPIAALAAADSMDVMYLIMKESMRAEYKDIMREEFRPLVRKYAVLAVLGCVAFLCLALAVGVLLAQATATSGGELGTCLPNPRTPRAPGEKELEELRALLFKLEHRLNGGNAV